MIDSNPKSELSSPNSIVAWRQRYERLGWRTIPLIGKAPLQQLSWTVADPGALWQSIQPDVDCNIGIILGDGLTVVDTDDDTTSRSVSSGLASMGLSPLVAKTPHGMHFYLRTEEVPASYNWSRLPAEVGDGEFRARNSYVVTPPSQVDGLHYRWSEGSPEDLALQPVVQWHDLAWLLPRESADAGVEELPIRLLHRSMPARARILLDHLTGASKGESVDRYPSRSEAEAAVMSTLILAGWTYVEILATFEKWQPGKYWDAKGVDRQRYFDRTYYRALSKIAAHPTRVAVAAYWRSLSADPLWVGRNGYTKRDTLLALLALCWQFASWDVFAPQRALAEHAATTQVTISKTLRALCADGFVTPRNAGPDRADADHWRVHALGSVSSQVMICDNSPRTEEWDLNELWSASALGRSASAVHGLLSHKPVTVTWLSRQTGKAWSTVDSTLDRLQRCGLARSVEGGWVRGARTLREVADEFDTKTRAQRRRERHLLERERFAERLNT